jgi:hypothetical protein
MMSKEVSLLAANFTARGHPEERGGSCRSFDLHLDKLLCWTMDGSFTMLQADAQFSFLCQWKI